MSDGKVADKVHVASTLVTRRRSQWTSTSLEASVAKFVPFHGNVIHFPSEMYCTNLGNVLHQPQKCIATILEMYCVTKHSTDPVFLITSIPLWTLRCCLTQLPLFLAPLQQRGSKIDRLHSRIFQHHLINKRYHVQRTTKIRNC